MSITDLTPAAVQSTFNAPLAEVDPEIAAVLQNELGRQREQPRHRRVSRAASRRRAIHTSGPGWRV